jgi:UDP-N-acetylmuramoylalanine--D-glutamate ligase
VVGMGVTGDAAVRAVMADGFDVVAVDDRPSERARRRAEALGVELIEAPTNTELSALVRQADLVVVSPGVPASHPVFRVEGPEVISEVELAWRRARAPIAAVTGTNGKTTVVTMVAGMLEESGVKAIAAGNIGLPLLDAVAGDAQVVVAEVSSFQLALTAAFRPSVATWLNLAEDHLDWHPDMEHYRRSKARIWANQAGDDVAVANLDDPVVAASALSGDTRAPARVVGFGEQGDWKLVGDMLTGPGGVALVRSADMPRALPHDVANGLAAAATAVAAGADLDACRRVLRSFEGLPHRVSLVATSGGVRFYDDSKATTPASVLAALAGFDSVVLVAGGRNKGLDLGALQKGASSVRSVVAIGEAAGEVAAAFEGRRPVVLASSMDEAVNAAAGQARPGDVVLLSPGCASFDWYQSYTERGDDFVRAVRSYIDGSRIERVR